MQREGHDKEHALHTEKELGCMYTYSRYTQTGCGKQSEEMATVSTHLFKVFCDREQ